MERVTRSCVRLWLLASLVLAVLVSLWPHSALAEQVECEPNDKRPMATSLALGEDMTGSLTAGDVDWYRYDVAWSGTFTVTLFSDLTRAGQVIDASLTDERGEELCALTVKASKGALTRQKVSLRAGRAYLKVWGAEKALLLRRYRVMLFLDGVVTERQNPPAVLYRGRMEGQGWKPEWKRDGATMGAAGKAQLIEAFQAKLSGRLRGGVAYRVCTSDGGWTKAWVSDGRASDADAEASAGSGRLEAVRIELTGDVRGSCDVWYRVYVEDMGWSGWASNGESAGAEGHGRGLEALQIRLVKRGDTHP